MLSSSSVFLLHFYFFFYCIKGTNAVPDKLNETVVYKCANSSAKSNLICLQKDLLKDYDRNVRPVVHHSNQTTVYMSIFPLSINMNEYYKNALVVLCWVTMKWEDELLKWDPKEYQNLDEFNTDTTMIWQPDIKPLALGNQWMYTKGTAHATVAASGTVLTAANVAYYAYCDTDYTHWPYDKHVCVVTLGSRTLRGPSLDVFFMKHKMPQLAYFKPSKEWELVSMNSSRKFTEIYDNHFVVNIELIFVIRRHASTFAAVTIVPGFVLAAAHLSTLCLNIKSSVRLILYSLSILCHCGLLQTAIDKIPANGGHIPLIVQFYQTSLLAVGGIFIWTVLACYLSSLTTSPYWLYALASRARNNPVLRYLWPDDSSLKNPSSQDSTEDESSLVAQSEGTSQWHNLVLFLDRIAFLACFLTYCVIVA